MPYRNQINWISLEDFKSREFTGHAWIRYKGRTVMAYYDKGEFHFLAIGGVYPTRWIEAVSPVYTPVWIRDDENDS